MKPLIWMRAVRDSELPRPVKNIAQMIGLRADQDGVCWPSYDLLAQDADVDRSHVIRHVKVLIAEGWLLKTSRLTEHGRSRSNTYRLLLPVDKPVDKPVDIGGRGGGTATPEGGGTATLVGWRYGHPEEIGQIEEGKSQPARVNGHVSEVFAAVARRTRIPP